MFSKTVASPAFAQAVIWYILLEEPHKLRLWY